MLVARILIAATLTIALVSGSAPFGLTSSGHLCMMSCCAGKAPHEAGSCMHGSCHVDFLAAKTASHPTEQEEHCGATKPRMAQHGEMHMPDAPAPAVQDLSAAVHRHHQPPDSLAQEQSPQNSSQPAPTIAVSMLTKPCPPDCGAGICSNSSQSRSRGSAALSHAGRPRPPSSLCLRQASYNPAKELDMLCRRSRPRGPPLSFS